MACSLDATHKPARLRRQSQPPTLPQRPPQHMNPTINMKAAKRTLTAPAYQLFDFTSVIDGLKKIYKYKLRPIEETYQFDNFYSPCLNDIDIESRPFMLLLGQYSTGKTSFVESLIRRSYPGSNIGPEPTTDRFTAVMYGKEERVIPGNAAAMSGELPFQGLSKFGTNFLSRFQVAVTPCSFLENVILIDTPGVLSGEKQRLNRMYDFASVIKWFAERADVIVLLFDAYKLGI